MKLLNNLLKFLKSEVIHWKGESWQPIPPLKMSPHHHLKGQSGRTYVSVHEGAPRVSYRLHGLTLLLPSFNYHSKVLGPTENSSQEYRSWMSILSYVTKTKFNKEITGRESLFFLSMTPSPPSTTCLSYANSWINATGFQTSQNHPSRMKTITLSVLRKIYTFCTHILYSR